MDWDEYFQKIVEVTAMKSKCPRRKVGCILVKDRRVIATGYNGMPPNFPDCSIGNTFCGKRPSGSSLHSIPCVHAETNALFQLNRLGGPCSIGAISYVTTFPCNDCLKALISSGIKEIVYGSYYHLKDKEAERTREFLILKSKIKIRTWEIK